LLVVRQQFTINAETSFECWIYVIRHAIVRDEFRFKGNDIAEFLDYKNPQLAIRDHVITEWRKNWKYLKDCSNPSPLENDIITPPNWQPHTVFISEPGLYTLVTRGKNPEAVKFTKWLYEEVLPSLRKTDKYEMN